MGFRIMALLILTFALVECSARRGDIFAEPASPVSPSSQEIPSDTVITLERTICFGTCPVYRLTILADGTVEFEGREYVRTKGSVKAKISQSQLQGLIREFQRIDYFSLENEYLMWNKACAENWTDSPSAISSIRINGRSKSVKHYYGCRGAKVLEDLTELERTIDKIANTDQWIK